MSLKSTSSPVWPLPVAIVTSIVVFAGTFFYMAEGVRLKEPRGLSPIGLAVAVFTAAMLFLTDAMVAREGKRRIGVSIAIVAVEAVVFTYAMMVLLLNVSGS